ncbi:MAG: hypothetical protein ACPGSC_09545 [Granulosicoccaceae bacterium]
MATRQYKPRFYRLALPLLSSIVCSTAYAVDFGTSVIYQYESSDNIDRVDQNAEPDDGSRHSVEASLNASTRATQLDMDFDLNLLFSEDSGADGDSTSTDARGGIYALYNIRPGQISWLFADYVVQQGEDLESLSNADERFLANYFVTGPSTSWRITPVDSINLDLFYLLADEESSDEQTRQLALQTDWSHRFSRQHTVGLHFDRSDITYKETDDEFSIVNTYGRYGYEQGKMRFNLDVGKSSTDEESADAISGNTVASTTDEDLFRVGFTRQMSRELSLNFGASQVFTDETFSTIRDLQSNLSNGVSTGSGPFYEKRVALGINRGDSIWNATLNVSNTDVEFVDDVSQIDDRGTQQLSLELGYSLSSRWGLRASVGQSEIDYSNIDRFDEELDYSFGASYQVAVSWGIALDASYSMVESNRPNDTTGTQEQVDIEENNVSLSIIWSPQTKLSRLREKYERKQIENVLQ